MRKTVKREHDDVNDRMEQVRKDLIDNEKQFHISYRVKMKELYANEEENSANDINLLVSLAECIGC